MTPVTYQAANGKQYVAAVAGGGDAAFHIPARTAPPVNATIVAFALQ
jgi:glucose dehydrogenase